jgi:hypothetical protein
LLLSAASAHSEQPLPVYPGTLLTPIGSELVISGEHYRLAYFTSADPILKVASYFQEAWQQQGYPTTRDGDFAEEGVVSAFFTREGLMQSVVLRRHQGRTVGFSVLKDLWVRQSIPPAPALVALEGTLFAQQLVARDDPGAAQHRSLLLERELEVVRDELHAKLVKQGFALSRETGNPSAGKRTRVLEYAKGPEQLVITVAEVGPGLTAVAQSWSRPAGPEPKRSQP